MLGGRAAGQRRLAAAITIHDIDIVVAIAVAVFVNRKLDHLIGETLTTRLMMRLG